MPAGSRQATQMSEADLGTLERQAEKTVENWKHISQLKAQKFKNWN